MLRNKRCLFRFLLKKFSAMETVRVSLTKKKKQLET